MFKRFLFCLPLIASFTVALAQPIVPGAALPGPPAGPYLPVPPVVPPSHQPCDCCAAKPFYDTKAWAPFVGTVAVLTQQRPQFNTSVPSLADQVVVIWDLHTKSGVPFDTWWTTTNPPSIPTTQYFSDPSWTAKNMGDVFGQSLDGKGNIYVAATTAYGNYKVGALATGNSTLQNTGQIYKIPSNTATPTPVPFVLLPNDGNGIGNIYYDCEFDSLYATDFYNGLIYRITPTGPPRQHRRPHRYYSADPVGSRRQSAIRHRCCRQSAWQSCDSRNGQGFTLQLRCAWPAPLGGHRVQEPAVVQHLGPLPGP
jgi:hypothetical protein